MFVTFHNVVERLEVLKRALSRARAEETNARAWLEFCVAQKAGEDRARKRLARATDGVMRVLAQIEMEELRVEIQLRRERFARSFA